MLCALPSERGLIDQFLAALRSLLEVQAELERAGVPEHDTQLARRCRQAHPRARRVAEGHLSARRP
jgi:hypothetical protein